MPMPTTCWLLLLTAHHAAGLRVGLCTRRGALASAAACALPLPALARGSDEAKATAAAREAKEATERLPLNRLKAARSGLASVLDSLESANPEWDSIREQLTSSSGVKTAGSGYAASSEGVAYTLRTAGKEACSASAAVERVKLTKLIGEVETFAYENQSVIPGALTGYCAPGVVPRDEAGSCKVKPIVEKGPAIAKLKTALSSFDSLLKECS